jgi:hypothetical protein
MTLEREWPRIRFTDHYGSLQLGEQPHIWGKTAWLWTIFANTQELVTHGKVVVPRCLTSMQLAGFPLLPEPPVWCIDKEKWPYQTRAWKEWLSEKRAGRSPPLPPAP